MRTEFVFFALLVLILYAVWELVRRFERPKSIDYAITVVKPLATREVLYDTIVPPDGPGWRLVSAARQLNTYEVLLIWERPKH